MTGTSQSPARDRVRAFLAAHDGFLHIGGIARQTQVHQATVKKVLEELEEAGRLETDRAQPGSPRYRVRKDNAGTENA